VSLTDSSVPLSLEERLPLVFLRVAALRPPLEDARACDCVRRLVAALDREPPLDFEPPLDREPPVDFGVPLDFAEPLLRDFAVFFERDVPWAILTPSNSFLRSATPNGGGVIRAGIVNRTGMDGCHAGGRVQARIANEGVRAHLTVAIIIVVCVVLLLLAFLLPRLSRYPQRGVDRTLGVGQRTASKGPGKTGRWLQKPFGMSRRATNKSAQKGRQGRSKLPL
jgi:hypothetical protein